jgi:hypothetical protein
VSSYLHLARSDRWAKVAQWVAAWVAPLAEGDGCDTAEIAAAEARLGFALPLALKEWYLLAGRRRDINHTQDALVPIEHLRLDGKWLVFYMENQGVVLWAVAIWDLQHLDPPGWMLADEACFQDTNTFSDFIFQMVLQQTLWLAPFHGMAFMALDTMVIIDGHFARWDSSDWHWPSYPTRRYGDKDTLIVTCGSTDIFVATRTKQAFDYVDTLLSNVEWSGRYDE